MPVRRPHGGSRTAVMAIREELDAWMASRPFRETSLYQEPDKVNGRHQESALVHVLVVEDGNDNNNDGQQDARLFKRLGPLLKLNVVRNLESAMSLLKAIDNGRHQEPDLIILDQKLFGIIAHEIFRSCQANSHLKNVQILVRPSIFVQKGILAA
jgi:CheY-like chemotaxis protein